MALAPGRYGETRVEAGATLSLTAGTYYLTSLAVLPGATLELDEKAGAVVVFVKSSFAFAGEERQEGSDGHVLIAAFGCEPSFLSAPFRGTVSAQNAWLSMIAPPKLAFAGRFFANSIEVGADTTVGGLGLTLPGPTQVAGRRRRGRHSAAQAAAARAGLLRDDAQRLAARAVRDAMNSSTATSRVPTRSLR